MSDKQHTLTNFDEKLTELADKMVEMGAAVRVSVELAGKALVHADEDILKAVRKNDDVINAFDEEIQQKATETIALMNPMAVDLRFVTSALRISVALERAGDITKAITKRMVRLKVDLPEDAREKMQEMIPIVLGMYDEALEAVRTRSTKKATAVWKRDEEADDLCSEVFAVMKKQMKGNPEVAHRMVDIMMAAKNFERLADYATNIAKTVHYVESGDYPRKKDVL